MVTSDLAPETEGLLDLFLASHVGLAVFHAQELEGLGVLSRVITDKLKGLATQQELLVQMAFAKSEDSEVGPKGLSFLRDGVAGVIQSHELELEGGGLFHIASSTCVQLDAVPVADVPKGEVDLRAEKFEV